MPASDDNFPKADKPAGQPNFRDVPVSNPVTPKPHIEQPKARLVARAPFPAGEDDEMRLEAVKRAKNPLLEAASVLLRAQADMPPSMDAEVSDYLLEGLTQEVRAFETLCTRANIRKDHMVGARYCLCTALDEMAMLALSDNGNTKEVNSWASKSLATTFHEDHNGGEKIYLLIGRLLAEPQEHVDLLEVIYRILSLGFEGRYRYEASGPRKHDAVRRRLYNEITARRGPVPVALSPHWQTNVRGKPVSFYDFPVWITVAVLSAILIGMFAYYKYELMHQASAVQRQIEDIAHMTPLPSAPALHLKELLKAEIANGTVRVDEDAHHSAVTFRGDSMFQPGGATVKETMGPLFAKIAGEIAKVPGKVTVLGYTDNVPIKSRQYTSNQALSEERATQVMQMLQAAGLPGRRLEAVGKGDADPVGDNRTVEGRAMNRRVEITVVQ